MSGIKTYLEKSEIASPTPIQTMAFNEILHTPNNFYIGAQTGTGKTLAYLLPIMQLLRQSEENYGYILTKPNRPRAIIFVPTKELTEQVGTIAKELSHTTKLSVLVLSNEHKFKWEAERLAEGVDIIVTNVARFSRH
jgi:superfamily II DNA/RNA helicase